LIKANELLGLTEDS